MSCAEEMGIVEQARCWIIVVRVGVFIKVSTVQLRRPRVKIKILSPMEVRPLALLPAVLLVACADQTK